MSAYCVLCVVCSSTRRTHALVFGEDLIVDPWPQVAGYSTLIQKVTFENPALAILVRQQLSKCLLLQSKTPTNGSHMPPSVPGPRLVRSRRSATARGRHQPLRDEYCARVEQAIVGTTDDSSGPKGLTCRKCGGRRIQIITKQLRSADAPTLSYGQMFRDRVGRRGCHGDPLLSRLWPHHAAQQLI